jgi:protein-disulfide isomerase
LPSSAPTTSDPTTRRDAPTPRPSPTSRGLVVPGLALLAVLILGLATLTGGGDEGATPPAGEGTAATGDGAQEAPALDLSTFERRIDGDPYAIGDVDAPVVMVEWADFQCRFCAQFSRTSEPELIERYVEDGTLRIEWRDLPILGEESWTAALGGRAAAQQGAFWEFHHAVFAVDRPVDSGELTLDGVVTIAGDLGLDVDRFRADLEDPALLEAVQRDRQEAQQLGATSTPAFLVNGRPILGAQPLEVFEAAIERSAEEATAADDA